MICPACGEDVARSEYLAGVFAGDPYAEWLANLVTHWRHGHIRSWNLAWANWRYREKAIRVPYDEAKAEVNNRAKRQIVRAVLKSRLPSGDKRGLVDAVIRLQNNDEKTLALREKALARLGGAPIQIRKAQATLEAWP